MGLPQEDAEFSFKEVPSDDWSFIVPSAFFSWNIGCEWRDRQMRRVADFRFRRYSQFSKAAVDRAVERADALASLINESMAYPASYITASPTTESHAYTTSHTSESR